METTGNINDSVVPGTSNRRAMQWWFRKFFKGDKSLEGEEHSGWLLEVDNNQLRTIIEAGPFTTAQEVAKQLNINHSVVTGHLKQTGKVKKPHELIENIKKNIVILKCHFLLFCTTMNHFSIGLQCVMKSGLYMATSNGQLSAWTKKKLQRTSQSKFAPKKMLWSLFGGLLSI